jgi:hypothetical protein
MMYDSTTLQLVQNFVNRCNIRYQNTLKTKRVSPDSMACQVSPDTAERVKEPFLSNLVQVKYWPLSWQHIFILLMTNSLEINLLLVYRIQPAAFLYISVCNTET